jgi:HAD superfamily hydrolase (TIGR01509 family)
MFEVLLWDNDGVLVDTEGLYYRATRTVLAGVGVTLDEEQYRELFLRQARGAWHLAEERGLSPAQLAALRADRDASYAALLDDADLVMPGVADAVAQLAGRYRMAIVTSSERFAFDRIHRRTGLLHHFELVLTREDYERCKPDPEPYHRALQRLGVAADRALVIEDSERGLFAARAAGLICWVLPSGLTRPCRFGGADRVLSGMSELTSLLLR